MYYEEKNQEIEHVLNVFIRFNSGGTTLSYSDLLLSTAASQWKDINAREEITSLVDDLNGIRGHGLELDKDFVLKAGLMLSDIASVGFKIRNFTPENLAILEKNWGKVRGALIETIQVVTGFGFNKDNLPAKSALLPIAYYIYRIGVPENFDSHNTYDKDRQLIRTWLTRSILKAGIWGSGLDTLLTAIREVIKEHGHHGFPTAEIQAKMATMSGKSLNFSKEEIEDLAGMEYKDKRSFALLSLLFPFIDPGKDRYDIDHIFPKKNFSQTALRKAGIIGEQQENFRNCFNLIGNLQLLRSSENKEKKSALPAEWIRKHYPDEEQRRRYCEDHLLGDVPDTMTEFGEFYEARRKRLEDRIRELVNSL